MEQVGEFLVSSQKQSSKSVVMGDIFFMFTRSLHYTQSHWMLLPINFLTVSFWLLWNDNWWTLSIDFVHVNDEQKLHWVIVQELNHNYTPFVSFLFEFSIFCSSTLLANKGSSRGSIPCRVGESGSKEQFSSRITLLRSSPWRSWWRFRMGLVVDRSRCKGPQYTVYLTSMVHYLKKQFFFSLQSQSSILLTSDFNKFL